MINKTFGCNTLISLLGEPDISGIYTRRDKIAIRDKIIEIHDPKTIEPLLNIVNNYKNTKAVEYALNILTGFNKTLPVELLNPIELLLNINKDRDTQVFENAVYILSELREPRAVEPLIYAMEATWITVTSAIATSLKKITQKNFGKNDKKWKEWWVENKDNFLENR